MQKLLIIIICSLIFIECNKVNNSPIDENDPSFLYKNSIADGFYMGDFVYQGKSYWCEIEFNKNKYEEWPSGGTLYQKEMSCLTLGTYTIIDNILILKLDSFKYEGYPFPCNPSMKLPGDYKIHLITENDSIVFSREVENNKIKYHLKRIIL